MHTDDGRGRSIRERQKARAREIVRERERERPRAFWGKWGATSRYIKGNDVYYGGPGSRFVYRRGFMMAYLATVPSPHLIIHYYCNIFHLEGTCDWWGAVNDFGLKWLLPDKCCTLFKRGGLCNCLLSSDKRPQQSHLSSRHSSARLNRVQKIISHHSEWKHVKNQEANKWVLLHVMHVLPFYTAQYVLTIHLVL